MHLWYTAWLYGKSSINCSYKLRCLSGVKSLGKGETKLFPMVRTREPIGWIHESEGASWEGFELLATHLWVPLKPCIAMPREAEQSAKPKYNQRAESGTE